MIQATPGAGSPSTAPNAAPRIGLDIGGTKAEGVVLDAEGEIEARLVVPIHRGAEGVVRVAGELAAELVARTGRGLDEFAGIGLGLPGQVDRETGSLSNASNLDILSFPIGPELAARTGLPVIAENDVTAASVGAVHLLDLEGTVAYLNIGTGLAAGVVVDGRPLRGAHGFAGELGHLPIDPRGRQCPCGQRGCLETAASGSALLAHWPAGGPDPGRALLAARDSGSPAARAEAAAAFDALVEGSASAIRALGLLIDPDVIVIGGGLRLIGSPLMDPIHTTLAAWARESPFLAALGLGERITVLPEHSPVAAAGAAWLVDSRSAGSPSRPARFPS